MLLKFEEILTSSRKFQKIYFFLILEKTLGMFQKILGNALHRLGRNYENFILIKFHEHFKETLGSSLKDFKKIFKD